MLNRAWTGEQIREARNWVTDVVADPERVENARDDLVVRYVEKYYAGGWDAFTEECCDHE